MKNHISLKVLIALTLVIITIIVRYPLMTHKTIVTHDEAISYLAAAGKQDDYGRDLGNRKILGKYIPAYEWKKYLKSENFFNFSQINESLAKSDVHPPFYFWLLHIWNHINGIDLQKGILLNILLACLSAVLVFLLANEITGSQVMGFLAAAGWSLSYSWDATFFVRQYETLGLISIAFYLFVYRIISKPANQKGWLNWIILSVITAFGFLTHIYFAPVAFGGFLFLIIKLTVIDKKNAKTAITKIAATILLAASLTLLLFPQYIQLLQKLFLRSGKNFPNPIREVNFKDSLYTLFYGLTGRYAFLIENFPLKGFFTFLVVFFSIIFLSVIIWVVVKKKIDPVRLFIPFILIWNVSIFSILYKSLKLADWAIGGEYYAHIIPLVPLAIASFYSYFKKNERYAVYALLIAFIITVSAGTIFYLNDLTSRHVYSPSIIFQHNPKIVCDNTARGDLFGLVMYIPDGSLLYVDTQDNLIQEPQKWASAFQPGDMLVCIESYDSVRSKQIEIVKAFEKITGKKLRFYPGYISNVYLYVLVE